MEKIRCGICKELFEPKNNCKTCDECKFKISEMPHEINYKERVKILRKQCIKQAEKKQKDKLSVMDILVMSNCSNCLWCRQVKFSKMAVYCSMPSCLDDHARRKTL